MERLPITVLKFGSSVLAGEERLAVAVHEIYGALRLGRRVVAVVSALGATTDQLLERARRFGEEPDPNGVAALVATGEATAAALLALALDRAGIPHVLLDAQQVGLRTAGPVLDAEPAGLEVAVVRGALAERPVAVMPGFVGRQERGGPSLLGRGGSDLTALFLADRLEALSCRLVKDVDGIYERDPAGSGRLGLRRYAALSWDDALRHSAKVVQEKALRFAAARRLAFEVAAPGCATATLVGPGPSRLEEEPPARPPLRVALLGLGTVGLGVYRHLIARPDRFEVVGVACRRQEPHLQAGIPASRLMADPWRVVALESDLVVEALGGMEPAASLIAAALERGRDVVTANKLVIAEAGPWLSWRAAAHRCQLRFSAAVGGGVPVLEAVARVAATGPVAAVRGVLNGTTNFVLDRIAAGDDFAGAVALARERGFAEADPVFDLEGGDAACKLRILSREAFGVELVPREVRCRGILELDPRHLREARDHGQVVRLVASCRRQRGGVAASVAPVALPPEDFLAGARGEENRVEVLPEAGPPVRLAGRGAGRWPTSEAVFADLLDLDRLRRAGEARLPRPVRLADGVAGQELQEPAGSEAPPAAVARREPAGRTGR